MNLSSLHIGAPAECWLWDGATSQGYGQAVHEGRVLYVHRFMYEQENGPIPAGLQLDHLCRTRLCANPAHLEAVTVRDNLLRGATLAAANAAKTHCPQGHPYAGRNLYVERGRRLCRTCKNARARRRRARSHA